MRTKITIMLILCSCLSAWAQWVPTNGLFSGEVHSILVSNGEIIVGAKYIYKSADNGKTWHVSNNGISGSVGSIQSLAKISSTIVAGTNAGVFYSTDNGDNWSSCAGTSSISATCIVSKGTNLFMSTYGAGIYKSTNNGVTWSAANTGISPILDMRTIVVKGSDLYAGTDGDGIYKSTNDGASWSLVNTGLPGSFYSVSSLAVVGNNIIAGTYGAGVYKSTNNGGTWTAINNGISSTEMIMALGVNGTSIYASTLTGNLYKTTDYINWNAVSVGTFTATRFEAFFSTGSDFYVGSWGFGSPEISYGLFKTTNDGNTWKHMGVTEFPISALEVSGSNILASSNDITGNSSKIALFKTTESDTIWNFNIGGFVGHNVSTIKANGAVAYLFDYDGGGNSQAYRSTNNGNNWTSTGYDLFYNHFTTFVIAGSLIYGADNSVQVSSDNGATWNSVNNGISGSASYVYSLALKGTTLFAATNNGIFKNTVGNNSWTAVNTGLTNLVIKSLYVLGTNIYAGSQGGGIFKSANDGALWTDANTGIPLFSNVTCFASSGSNVFAGTDNGVFLSTNAGSSWSNINLGLIDTSITAMVASSNYLWAGTSSQGVWKRGLSQLIGSAPASPGPISGSTNVCNGSTNTYSVTAVSGATSYTWTLPNGWSGSSATNSINASAGQSGSISVTANNSFGSSSPTSLAVTVNSVNTAVTQSGLTLTANASGAGYTWIDCNGFAPVGGQTSQSFTAAIPGTYAVIVSQSGCIDTSACFSADTNCSISISGSDLPFTGLSILLSVDTVTAVTIGNAGASQSWDYSALSWQYQKVADYKSTSATPYASDFPASNIYTYGQGSLYASLYGGAPVGPGNNGYVFWKSDNSGFWVTGFRPVDGLCAGINVQDNPNELLIGTPASYGSVFNNSSRWVLPLDRVPSNIDTFYVRNVNKVITADACGSLTTPYALYPSVLREHEYAVTVDSIYMRSSGVLVTSLEFARDTINTYSYIATGIGYPVCIVHADKNNNVKDVEYYSGPYSSIEPTATREKEILLYPNPTHGNITIEIPENEEAIDQQLYIFNSIGGLVWQENSRDAIINIDMSNFDKGIYFLKIISNNGNYTKRFVIQ